MGMGFSHLSEQWAPGMLSALEGNIVGALEWVGDLCLDLKVWGPGVWGKFFLIVNRSPSSSCGRKSQIFPVSQRPESLKKLFRKLVS